MTAKTQSTTRSLPRRARHEDAVETEVAEPQADALALLLPLLPPAAVRRVRRGRLSSRGPSGRRVDERQLFVHALL
jgi:hypothetical protein